MYVVYSVRPLKGFKNGDRSLKIELKPGLNIGSYHVLDGQKVSLKYLGQQQTCARCHKTSQNCKGNGLAKKCEAAGGEKIDFIDHILQLWRQIGYSPSNTSLEEVNAAEDLVVQVGGNFTPTKTSTENVAKYTGVSIKGFQKDADHIY